MIKIFVTVVVVVITLMVGLPWYLGPDDISGCQAPTSDGKCQTVDAIIAVSGGDTPARTAEAIRLYQEGWSELLIFSGAALDTTGKSNAEAMREQAFASGVPSTHIIIEELSYNTAENAKNTAKLIESRSFDRVMLVTSAYHQRRTSLEFERQLGNAVEIVNHPVANDKQWSSWWWMTPYGWWLGIGEIVKIIFSGFLF